MPKPNSDHYRNMHAYTHLLFRSLEPHSYIVKGGLLCLILLKTGCSVPSSLAHAYYKQVFVYKDIHNLFMAHLFLL